VRLAWVKVTGIHANDGYYHFALSTKVGKADLNVFAATGNVQIAYEEAGRGPLICLLHGGMASSRSWAPVAESLGNNYHLVMPDLLGCGGSSPNPENSLKIVPENARALSELLNHIGKPLVLAGHSLGGTVAFHLAMQHKLPLKGLVLFEPSLADVLRAVGDAKMLAWHNDYFVEGGLKLAQAGNVAAVRVMVDGWSGEGSFERLPETVQNYLNDQIAAAVGDMEACMNEPVDVALLKQFAVPALLMAGTSGAQFGATMCRHLAENFPNSALRLLDDADHSLTITHADICAQAIESFATNLF